MKFVGGVGVAGLATLVGVSVLRADDTRRYPLPLTVASNRLAAAGLPEPLRAFGAGSVSLAHDDRGLVWRLGDPDHRSIARAILVGDGASTRVSIRFTLADNALDYSHIGATPMTRSLAKSLVAEHVDSVLGGRAFDQRQVARFAAGDYQANPNMLKQFGEAVRQDMIDVADQLHGTGMFAVAPVIDPERQRQAATRADPDSVKPTTTL